MGFRNLNFTLISNYLLTIAFKFLFCFVFKFNGYLFNKQCQDITFSCCNNITLTISKENKIKI